MSSVHETWKQVPGFEGYEVSSLGRVRSMNRVIEYRDGRVGMRSGKVLSAGRNSRGYLSVVVGSTAGSTRRSCTVHSLVATAFIGERPANTEVNHIDGNKTNNLPANLEFVTHRKNVLHAHSAGLTDNKGEKHYRSRLTKDCVLKILDWKKDGVTHIEMSRRLGVCEATVFAVLHGKSWGHITGIGKEHTA